MSVRKVRVGLFDAPVRRIVIIISARSEYAKRVKLPNAYINQLPVSTNLPWVPSQSFPGPNRYRRTPGGSVEGMK